MADNTATARKQLEGARAAVREHAKKYRDYSEDYEKNGAWKTIQNAQGQISKLKGAHPSLNTNSKEDSWRPGDAVNW